MVRGRWNRWLVIVGMTASGASIARAQQPDPAFVRFQQLLAAPTSPKGADRNNAINFITNKAVEMWAAETDAETSAAAKCAKHRFELLPIAPGGGNPQVLREWAAIYKEALTPFLAKQPKSGHAVAQISLALGNLRTSALVDTYKTLAAWPPSPDFPDAPGARYWAFKAFQGGELKNEIGSGANPALRNWLVERSAGEDSEAVLAEIFSAMDLTSLNTPAATGHTVEMIVGALKARNAYYQKGRIGGIGGECRGLGILEVIGFATAGSPVNEKFRADVLYNIARLQFIAGTFYTEFDVATVNALTIQRIPVLEARRGLWETVIRTERILFSWTANMKPAPAKAGLNVETPAFRDIVALDPVTNDIGLVFKEGDKTVLGKIDITKYRAFLTDLNARKKHVESILAEMKAPAIDIPAPTPLIQGAAKARGEK